MRRGAFEIIAFALSLGVVSCVVDDEVDPADSEAVERIAYEEEAEAEPADLAADPTTELDQGKSVDEPKAPSGDSVLSPQGQVCGGMCRYNANWAWNTCRWNVTQNCRDRIVEFCHNRGWGFIDAYWAGSCADGWIRLWPI
jgi:hypothetical protein